MIRPDTSVRIPVVAARFGAWHLSLTCDPLSSEQSRWRYGRMASYWPCMLRQMSVLQTYAQLAQHLVRLEWQTFHQGARVLDCGAGTGALSLAIAAATDVPLSFDLLDASPEMLYVAERSCSAMRLNARMTQGDIRCLPFDNALFDLAIAAHVVEHLADPVLALREMRRVVKPSGRVLVLMTPCGLLGRIVQVGWRVHCATEAQLLAWFQQAGFTEARFLRLDDHTWHDRLSLACVASSGACVEWKSQ